MTAQDHAWRTRVFDVLVAWTSAGVIGPVWGMVWDQGDGCYRISYTMPGTLCRGARRYNLTEAQFCERVIALADMFPDEMGAATLALADEVRKEASL